MCETTRFDCRFQDQFSGLTGDWFDLGWPWKSGSMKFGYVDDANSPGVHPHLSAAFGLNLLTWGAVILSLRLLLALKDRRWPVVVAKVVIIGVLLSALIVAAPGFVRMAERCFG